ncbi:phage tail assembly protein [Cedecea sp.]|jgi:hypothetical protein|uniref:phage tail assembly protein n=1 Tax=Cedecea sp. TaxID=1970739 RepID=UPI002F42DFEA
MELNTSSENTVVLETPIKRGDSEIREVQVTKPNAGSLRGIGLAALANADVDALITILPRVTYPNLTKEECARLELPDLIALAGQVIGFLSPKSAE